MSTRKNTHTIVCTALFASALFLTFVDSAIGQGSYVILSSATLKPAAPKNRLKASGEYFGNAGSHWSNDWLNLPADIIAGGSLTIQRKVFYTIPNGVGGVIIFEDWVDLGAAEPVGSIGASGGSDYLIDRLIPWHLTSMTIRIEWVLDCYAYIHPIDPEIRSFILGKM